MVQCQPSSRPENGMTRTKSEEFFKDIRNLVSTNNESRDSPVQMGQQNASRHNEGGRQYEYNRGQAPYYSQDHCDHDRSCNDQCRTGCYDAYAAFHSIPSKKRDLVSIAVICAIVVTLLNLSYLRGYQGAGADKLVGTDAAEDSTRGNLRGGTSTAPQIPNRATTEQDVQSNPGHFFYPQNQGMVQNNMMGGQGMTTPGGFQNNGGMMMGQSNMMLQQQMMQNDMMQRGTNGMMVGNTMQQPGMMPNGMPEQPVQNGMVIQGTQTGQWQGTKTLQKMSSAEFEQQQSPVKQGEVIDGLAATEMTGSKQKEFKEKMGEVATSDGSGQKTEVVEGKQLADTKSGLEQQSTEKAGEDKGAQDAATIFRDGKTKAGDDKEDPQDAATKGGGEEKQREEASDANKETKSEKKGFWGLKFSDFFGDSQTKAEHQTETDPEQTEEMLPNSEGETSQQTEVNQDQAEDTQSMIDGEITDEASTKEGTKKTHDGELKQETDVDKKTEDAPKSEEGSENTMGETATADQVNEDAPNDNGDAGETVTTDKVNAGDSNMDENPNESLGGTANENGGN